MSSDYQSAMDNGPASQPAKVQQPPVSTAISKNDYIDPDAEETLAICEAKQTIGFAQFSGLGNRKQPEIKPSFMQTTNEVVIDGKTNCFIVLGSDRPGSEASGRGGVGATGASAIDLVVGHMGPRPVTVIDGEKVKVSKNFELDAARLYISQQTDLDSYLNIPKRPLKVGSVELDLDFTEKLSGIAMKADAIRIVGRENIKIVTAHLGSNSKNLSVAHNGVDIIAGYEIIDSKHSLEPMVKGNKLIQLLKEMLNGTNGSQSILANFLKAQIAINEILITHRHQCGKTVSNTMIESTKIADLNRELKSKQQVGMIVNTLKTRKIESDYFSPMSDKFINSLYNRVN
jgi:hypothetical protein